jgi:OFA family oxalate/formate antiporter-like MFS transporter
MNPKLPNRWLVAAAGVVMQIALGAVYAWSVFRIPLMQSYGWTIPQATLIFELAIFTLGLSSFAGGWWLRLAGPRLVAVVGGICYGLGTVLAGRAGGDLLRFTLSYGVLGGIGLGLCYIVPVATLIKWFPDRRGMMTGLAVAGFGAGALITAPVAARLIAAHGISQTFVILGVSYLILVTGSALFMRSPPEGFRPPGSQAAPDRQPQRARRDYSFGEALRTWQWYGLWAMLFLNTLAGISLISQISPLSQEVTHVSATVAAGLVGAIAIANGSGRLLWSWLSDFIGRPRVFLAMSLVQAVAFLLLARVQSFGLVAALSFAILLCYGGGFGTMPAFTADYYGARNVGSIYGLMLTAWGSAGLIGPTFIAYIRQSTGRYTEALDLIGAVMFFSALLPFYVRPPNVRTTEPAAVVGARSIPN